MLLWTQAGAKSNIQQTIGMGALSVPHSCLDCSMQPVIEECHSNPLWCTAMLCSRIHNWALVHGLHSYLQAYRTTPRKESTSLLLSCTPSHNLLLAIPHFWIPRSPLQDTVFQQKFTETCPWRRAQTLYPCPQFLAFFHHQILPLETLSSWSVWLLPDPHLHQSCLSPLGHWTLPLISHHSSPPCWSFPYFCFYSSSCFCLVPFFSCAFLHLVVICAPAPSLSCSWAWKNT